MVEISERIKKRRLELGLTLEDVSEKLGVAKSTILRYETKDIGNMGIDKLELLANALKCTPAYLMGWELEKTSTGYTVNDGEDEIKIELIDVTKDLTPTQIKALINFAKFIKQSEENDAKENGDM